MKYSNLLLAVCCASTLIAPPASAKKEFTKTEASKKSPLGDNVITTKSGLQYRDAKAGTGAEAMFGNVVWIDYTAWVMPDAKEVDSTKQKGKPLNIVLGGTQICPGVDEGIMKMKVGGVRQLLIPPELGFPKGSSTSRLIPPGSTLKYEITLVHVGPKLPKKPEAKPTDAKPKDEKTAPKPAVKPAIKPTEKPN